MTLRFPVAIWQDVEGMYTAQVIDGDDASAIDVKPGLAIRQLRRYLMWKSRTKGGVLVSRLDHLRVVDHRVTIRAEYRTPRAVHPVSPPQVVRIAAIHGRQPDGGGYCAVPSLGIRLAYREEDGNVEELLAELVRQVLGKLNPQELAWSLPPERLTLDAVHVREQRRARSDDWQRRTALELVADPVGARTRGGGSQRALCRDTILAHLTRLIAQGAAGVLLVGERGVGKSTLLVETARRALREHREQRRNDEQRPSFWRTSGQRLIAGMQYLGQWEERCEDVISELGERRGVLFVDDLLELVRVGGREPGGSVAAFLAPYVARGELRLVGEATPSQLDACRRLLPGFADLFRVVMVPELREEDARRVLDGLLQQGRRDLKLAVDEGLAELLYRLFKRFQPYSPFPGRAAAFTRRLIEAAAEERDAGRRITADDVLTRFQRESGLPQRLLRDELPLPYEQVLGELTAAVVGQEEACRVAADVVVSLKTGLTDPRRPLGVLLFCGPTGVGKTELAKVLARQLFGAGAAQDRLVRLDMSEYSGYGAAQRLVLGADGDVSDFIRRMRRQPFSVVLLDEIEKASPDVHDMLLGLLDEARLTDRFGRTTNFHSAVVVMTSNLGAERMAPLGIADRPATDFERIAMETFRPEFFNRIDAVVSFQPLERESIHALAARELEGIAAREGLSKLGVTLRWTPAVLELLGRLGYDARYGARPLLRAVEQQVVAPLSRWLLDHPGVRSVTLTLDVVDNRVKVL